MTRTSHQRKRTSASGKEKSTGVPALRVRPAWALLERHYHDMKGLHLRQLFARDRERGERLAVEAAGIYLDYSKNRVTDETLRLLLQLAHESGLRERIDAMFRGDKINVSENRAALHVALRAPPGASILQDGRNVVPESGAGHFVKMVHNGIEYGVMAAYAEGFAVLEAADLGKRPGVIDAETTPLRDPGHYQYDLDLADIAEVWRRGSVIASWLLDLTAVSLIRDPSLASFAGRVSDSGEGRWTIKAAIDEGVPVHVLSSALYERFSSRGEADFANKLLSAMRYEFGGHLEKQPGRG